MMLQGQFVSGEHVTPALAGPTLCVLAIHYEKQHLPFRSTKKDVSTHRVYWPRGQSIDLCVPRSFDWGPLRVGPINGRNGREHKDGRNE
jgi:hypothetical protein